MNTNSKAKYKLHFNDRFHPLKRFLLLTRLLSLFQVTTFDDNDLCNSLKFCSKGHPFIGKTFDQPNECEALVKELWPSCPALQESAEVEKTAELFKNLNM